MKTKQFDFSGWATKNDLKCSDGRTIRKNAFKMDDGRTVPLVWMHQHNDPNNVLGHAVLENRDEGVYAYCSFNDSPSGRQAKEIVRHGDVQSLSIWANNLDQSNGNVMHGSIKEVSVVLAGANPGAVIDFPYFAHSDEEDTSEAFICVGSPIEYLSHEDAEEEAPKGGEEDGDQTVQDVLDSMNEKQRQAVEFLIGMALQGGDAGDMEELQHADEDPKAGADGGETVKDVLDTMTDVQRKVTEYLVGMALQEQQEQGEAPEEEEAVEHSDIEMEEDDMKTNTFEAYSDESRVDSKNTLSHADGLEILQIAKDHGGMSLKAAMGLWAEANNKEIMHSDLGINDIDTLFPEYKDVKGGAPDMLTTDQGWITKVLNKVHKSPMSRLRTRQADVRDIEGRRAKGYKKGTMKDFAGNIDLITRTTDPITVYVKSKLDRDDIIDITDFNVVDYMYKLDRMNLNEELARAIMIGDGRSGDKAIDPTKIRPIWLDDELYTIHTVVDVAGMRTTMNGTNSSANFGDNYVYAEAILQSLLYARENYKGSGSPDFYCTPHLVNVMLLARDLNGRRIYDNVNELKAALNVNEIITVEQFAGKTRSVTVNGVAQTRGLLGIMVNLADYTVGATKGGEITHFTDFDLNFNQEISLLETRCSGSLLRPFAAIALEEVVNPQ